MKLLTLFLFDLYQTASIKKTNKISCPVISCDTTIGQFKCF